MEAISSDDVFTFWNFHVVAQSQGILSFARSKGKMKYQYDKELAHTTTSKVTSH